MNPSQAGINRPVEAELWSDEQLLWAGRPSPSIARLVRKNIVPIVLGVIWTGFVLFMINAVNSFGSQSSFGSRSGPPDFFMLILGLFVLVGLGVILTPLWSYLKLMRTVYAITDHRMLIILRLFGSSVVSYNADDIQQIHRTTYGDDVGDIVFRREQRTRWVSNTAGTSRRREAYYVPIGFFSIPDVREVEQVMRETFRKKSSVSVQQKLRSRAESLKPFSHRQDAKCAKII